VRHARRDEQIGSRGCADHHFANLPFAFALQHVEGFFLDTVNMEAGGAGIVQSNMLVCFVSSPATRNTIGWLRSMAPLFSSGIRITGATPIFPPLARCGLPASTETRCACCAGKRGEPSARRGRAETTLRYVRRRHVSDTLRRADAATGNPQHKFNKWTAVETLVNSPTRYELDGLEDWLPILTHSIGPRPHLRDGSNSEVGTGNREVRFTPNTGHCQQPCPQCAKQQLKICDSSPGVC
jgi:hypothetical protein